MFDFALDPAFGVGRTPFQAALERRLRARAARADSGVELTPQLLHRWLHEEVDSIHREIEAARSAAKQLAES